VDILDRIAALLRALFGDGPAGSRSADANRASDPRFADPDVARAWEELNEDLGREASSGTRSAGARSGGTGTRSRGTGGSSRRADGGRTEHPLESLRQDYANLEVPFGSDIATVRRAYKRLVLRYHPDRHAGQPEKLRVATEITKRINESFERLRAYLER
jgi:DnaJ-domain-containing protein 1